MKKLYFATTIILMLLSSVSFGQRVSELSGNLAVLNGLTRLNVIYDYSDMTVGKKSEKDYVQDKKSSYNQKEPGKGDKWEKDWFADRAARFEPRFEEEFNKNGSIQVGFFPKEKYSLIFKTTFTEPGFNIGIERKNASIDGEVWIVETTNQSNVVAKLSCEHCPGRTAYGSDFDNGERIQEAYAMAGKGIARYFVRNAK